MSEPAVTSLLVTHSLSRMAGGLFATVRRLAQCLRTQGTEVEVYGLWDNAFDADVDAWAPLRPRAYRAALAPWLGYAPRLRPDLSAGVGPRTVIHLHGLWKMTSRDCLLVSEENGVPRLITPSGMLDAWALRQSAFRKRVAGVLYERRNLGSAACLHALCQAELRQVRDFGLRTPVAVIPNGVDLPEDIAAPEPALPKPAEGKQLMLFLSRVHPKKGLVPLVTAWSAVIKTHPDWFLGIAGPDEAGHAGEVQALIDRLGLGSSAALLGGCYGERKAGLLRRAAAFVLPSFSEGFPMAALEAMAARLPVLMTPQCNFPEAHACGAALLAEPRPADLAGALERMMALSESARGEMGRRGRDLVAARYSWDRIAEQMATTYRWLLGETGQPDWVAAD